MSWYHHAKPGDKVVLVDDDWPPLAALLVELGCVLPEINVVYTIRMIGQTLDGDWILRLVEIVNPSFDVGGSPPGEPRFGVRRFRPATARPTDISVFTSLLNSAPEKVDA